MNDYLTTEDVQGAARKQYAEATRRFNIAADRADAAFARYFTKLQAGEPTNGAAVARADNLASYASADLAVAETAMYAAGLDDEVELQS